MSREASARDKRLRKGEKRLDDARGGGWVSKKTVRNKFQGRKPNPVPPSNMKVEEFSSREARDARWRELRQSNTSSRHVTRSSTSRTPEGTVVGKMVWLVIRPIQAG